MKGKLIYIIFTVLIACNCVSAQENKMTPNRNWRDADFIQTSELSQKILKLGIGDDFKLYLEKENDSINSIYFLNLKNEIVHVDCQDSSLRLIQEAKDNNGVWQPVEYWRRAWCGNSYYSLEVKPNEIINTKSKTYGGNYITEIRYKLLSDGKNYYTNAIEGKIQDYQLRLSKRIENGNEFHNLKNVAGISTAKKVLFLDCDGASEYLKKMRERDESLRLKREQSNKTSN